LLKSFQLNNNNYYYPTCFRMIVFITSTFFFVMKYVAMAIDKWQQYNWYYVYQRFRNKNKIIKLTVRLYNLTIIWLRNLNPLYELLILTNSVHMQHYSHTISLLYYIERIRTILYFIVLDVGTWNVFKNINFKRFKLFCFFDKLSVKHPAELNN